MDCKCEEVAKAQTQLTEEHSFAWQCISIANKTAKTAMIVAAIAVMCALAEAFAFVWLWNQYDYMDSYNYASAKADSGESVIAANNTNGDVFIGS